MKTEYMGGKFYANITDAVQYLVTNGVRSTKYLVNILKLNKH